MSDNGAPQPPRPLPVDPMVAATSAAMSKFFGDTIEGLTKDMENLLNKNGAGKTEVGKAVTTLTANMIRMLGERVRATVPAAGAAGAGEGPSEADGRV
jgi:hypothetical protein